jgi:hypothetical protein
MRVRSLLAISVALLFASCRGQPAGLSPSTTPLDPTRCTVLGPAEGSAYGAVVLFIPMFTRQAPLARDRAIASVPGATDLTEISLSYKIYPLILVTLTKTTVRGNAVVAQ